MDVGVLAVQGDFAEHGEALARVGARPHFLRKPEELDGLRALVLPGGESTTMLKILTEEGWLDPIRDFVRRGGALYGTCAGAILMAERVRDPEQPSFGFLPIAIQRNAYGRQVASHVNHEPCLALGEPPLEMVFIRAPIILEVAADVEVLARHRGQPVFVRKGRAMATTFHPELTRDDRVHGYFVKKVAGL